MTTRRGSSVLLSSSSLLLLMLLVLACICTTKTLAQETATTTSATPLGGSAVETEEHEVLDLDAQVVTNETRAPVDSSSTAKEEEEDKAEIPAVKATEEPNNEILDEKRTAEQPLADELLATATQQQQQQQQQDTVNATTTDQQDVVQSGPFIDIFGNQLLSLQMIDETHARLEAHRTNDALQGKKVIGLYFSADWCGPCRKFTPELVSFYKKMNDRRGKKNQFEIVWISRCRDTNAFGQYFTQMGGWYALPPEEAMGQRGMMLGEKYKVKSIPTLVLLDEYANVITLDGRNKIPQDKAGIGFPWRNPLSTLYMTVLPRSLRLMIKSQVLSLRNQIIDRIKLLLGLKKRVPASIAK